MTDFAPMGAFPVSVVVSTLGRPERLGRCLDALLTGTRLPAEVVIVDQGDTAATADVIRARCDRDVPLVHISQNRRGLSVSQNAGITAARCEVVSIVDDDCVPGASWVEVAAREHAFARKPLLIGGRVLPMPPDGDRTISLSARASSERTIVPLEAPPWRVGTGGNFSVTRAAYLQVGGNDERLGTGSPGRAGNDLDLFRRLQRAGVEARFEPDMVVLHERATAAEYRSRQWSYGFGFGVCVAAWIRDGDRSTARILASWIIMRVRRLLRATRVQAALDEVRVLLGTAGGIWHGIPMGPRRLMSEVPPAPVER